MSEKELPSTVMADNERIFKDFFNDKNYSVHTTRPFRNSLSCDIEKLESLDELSGNGKRQLKRLNEMVDKLRELRK